MSGDLSAYEALGLGPDADQAAVERAYKKLIKRYHPDREGGDPVRAAEINEAYFQLRKSSGQSLERDRPRDLAEALYAERVARRRYVPPRRRRRPLWPLLAVAVAIMIYVLRTPLLAFAGDLRSEVADRLVASDREADQALVLSSQIEFDGPLNHAKIGQAVRQVEVLGRGGDLEALKEESRACHQALRADPSLPQLDRCAAFDDAVIEIQNRGTIQEGGDFGPSTVTARQMAAAKLLSSNYDAIEERLDRVRSEVQQALAAPEAVADRS